MALVSNWKLDAGSGTTAVDSGPAARNGTIVGASWLATGGPNSEPCLSFDGVDNRVDIADHASIDVSTFTNYSMGAWIFPTAIAGTDDAIIYSYGNWGAAIGPSDFFSPQNRIQHSRNNTTRLFSNTNLQLNQWQHIVVTRTPTTTTFYLNGVPDGSGASVTINDDTRGSGIGNRFGSGTIDAGYAGRISDVRLYNHALTAQEVEDWVNGVASDVSGTASGVLAAATASASGTVAAAGGQTFYITTVANGGSDSSDGSEGTPWATFNFADTQIVPGDTVIVKPGTYQQADIVLTTSGTSGARVTWSSEVKHGAIIQPVDNQTELTVVLVRADYLDFEGFEIDGTPYPECNGGIEQGQSHSRTYNCHVHHVRALGGELGQGGAGIMLSGFWGTGGVGGEYTGTDHDAFNNIIHDIGNTTTPGEFTHGIYPACPVGKVYNNLIYRIEASGIHLWHNARTYEITNNTIFECGDAGILCAADVSIGSLIDTKVSNNIVIGCETGLIEEGSVGTGNEYRNNTFFACVTAVSGAAPISGTLTTDPELVNYQADGSGNYHLAAGSPSIDSGLATWAPAMDYDGVARPQGAGDDRGAFEFVSSESGFKLGETSIGAIGLGSTDINRLYIGSSLFWSG